MHQSPMPGLSWFWHFPAPSPATPGSVLYISLSSARSPLSLLTAVPTSHPLGHAPYAVLLSTSNIHKADAAFDYLSICSRRGSASPERNLLEEALLRPAPGSRGLYKPQIHPACRGRNNLHCLWLSHTPSLDQNTINWRKKSDMKSLLPSPGSIPISPSHMSLCKSPGDLGAPLPPHYLSRSADSLRIAEERSQQRRPAYRGKQRYSTFE